MGGSRWRKRIRGDEVETIEEMISKVPYPLSIIQERMISCMHARSWIIQSPGVPPISTIRICVLFSG